MISTITGTMIGAVTGTGLASPRGMSDVRLVFDGGSLLLQGLPADLNQAGIPGLLWDPQAGAHRAPACTFYSLAAELRRRGVPLTDHTRPDLAPVSSPATSPISDPISCR